MSIKKLIWTLVVLAVVVAIAAIFWPRYPDGMQDPYSAASVFTLPAAPGLAATVTGPDASSSLSDSANNNLHMITIQTNKGTIVFETYDADAPNTVKNFITLANKGFYNGTIFHRVIDGFMIQGGDPTGTGRGGPGYQFADELNPSTASYKAGYTRGTVAMANSGPNTNGSQFFIMQSNYPLPNNYSIFGHVVSGQDVVDAIAKTPRDGNDKPLSPVTMEKVTVSDVK